MRYPRGRWPDRAELVRLARAAQRGEPRALDALLTALRPSFERFFARRIPSDTAEDLTQAALIRVALELGERDAERIGHLVTTIAHTLLHTEYLRRARAHRRSAHASLGEVVTSPMDITKQIEYEDLVHAVHGACVKILPPELREVVRGMLRDLNPAEIAAELGVEHDTIRKRLQRARIILRRELWPYVEGGMRAGALVAAFVLEVTSAL
jgi:RNA polymerase sigma factor (sigma-70 family)